MRDKTIYSNAPIYFHYYFDLIEGNDLIAELTLNAAYTFRKIEAIPDSRWHLAYAQDKWTMAEVIRHIIETERIFSYRALRFSRHDSTPLPGFDENNYIAALKHVEFTKQQLMDEFRTLRESTIQLFKTMTPDLLQFAGSANGATVTAEMLGFMIVGHGVHHLHVLDERYMQ
jgi:uncharacterized damage-inducible protein DinB